MKSPDDSQQPRVLILLATHNGEPWLNEQVTGLLNQTGVDVRVLASDDASSDGTQRLLERWAHTDPRLQILPSASGAGSAAANFRRLMIEADIADHTHIAFSDQDDIWSPAKLSTACSALSDGLADLYSASVRAWWPNGKEVTLTQSSRQRGADYLFEGAGQGCTFVMSRDLFEQLRGFVQANTERVAALHYHDWMVYALTRTWHRKWIYDPRPCMRYRQHAGNDTGAQSSASGIRRRLALIASEWYRTQVTAMIGVCIAADPNAPMPRMADGLLAASRRNWSRRLPWIAFLMRHGRRRLRDRAILCVAALCGRL